MENSILNYEDLMDMLDDLLREPKPFWESFYEDRTKDIPFFQVKGPDENLVDYFERELEPRKVLDLGCGPGRNAIYMAKKGCIVDAIDISEKAIEWANERAIEEGVNINLFCNSLFDFEFEEHSYDFIYDSGLFHHLAPHRRLTYIEIIKKLLKVNGKYGLVCFNTDGAVDTPDWNVYKERSLKGGIGYTEKRLKEVFEEDFNIIEFRKMKDIAQPSDRFGYGFLWIALMERLC
ncbi:class I SAM-dependent methyltransferase [Bacillus suaedaesalsae]|uniref:Class I SAM-dependent methyltransferase n=1 Tax=Bacillus suaedaesalsae TaxID=2810349 RepID=A0ABS2DHU3_9BACI|nr:class I SAM-dependent methyltransferase [Bacillus suaedaesalsae]MBM6618064.1 class I SAM-dependent methyltransferase [Bacillus suaedaesalsae]